MWQRLFSGPWPETENLLPAAVQEQTARQIRDYWRTRGWELILGGVVLWAAATYYEIPYSRLYGALAGMIAIIYLLGLSQRLTTAWLAGVMLLLLLHGVLINGLGAVTALAFLMPHTFAGMICSGRRRLVVQTGCTVAFWISLVYDIVTPLPQLYPPGYILVGYDVLFAAFTFQTFRFLNRLTVEMNTAYVAEEVQGQSQQFLARVSHELRTPLNSVLGFAKLLRRAELTEAQVRYLESVIDEGEQLNRLVSDLLDSAHLSTGKLTLSLEDCDVNAVCTAVAEEQRPNLPLPVALRVDLAPALPVVRADGVRLRQAVGNLVANAVKYTEAGEIGIKTCVDGARLLIEVWDTGVGIPEAQQRLIFTPFVQLDARRIGVGLGLDIALQLVRLHGGDIHVQSMMGQGSTFTIALPLPDFR